MKTFKALIILFTVLNLSSLAFGQESVIVDTELYGQSYKLWLEQKRQNATIKIPEKIDFEKLSEMLTSNGFGPGNGGNEYIFEVDSIAKDLLTYLDKNTDLQMKVSLDQFEEVLQDTSLFFIDNLPKLDERVVDALNWSNGKLILIDRMSWKKLSLEMKYKLIFHEYLGVMGVEVNNAFLSNQFNLKSFLIGQKRFEMDWSGTTYIYSHSNNSEYAIQFDIDEQSGKATIVTSNGSSEANWQERSEKLYIVPSSKIQYDHPTYKFEDNIQLTGKSVLTLIDITIQKTSFEQMIVDETWSVCFISDDPNQNQYNKCEFIIKKYDQSLIYTRDLKSRPITLKNDDIVSYPAFTKNGMKQFIMKVSQDQLIFVHGLKENYRPIKSWSMKKNHLKINYTNGDTLTLTKLKELYGLDRVLARYKTKANSFIAVTGFIHSSPHEVPLLTYHSVKGDYLPMYINSQHSAEEYPTYSFNDNGLGGFETSFDFDMENYYNPWFWSIKDNIISADRYRYLVSGEQIQDPAVLSSCLKQKTCYLSNHRKYIPLKVSGHRYTFLRIMEFYRPDGTVRNGNGEVSFWVMDKI